MLSRRELLQSSLLAGSAAAISSVASAIEPIARNGKSKFKFSLAAYSYRGLLAGDKATLTLKDFVDDCAKFGLEGTELTSYYFPKDTTPDYLRALRRQAFRLGLDISGTAVGNEFGHPAGEKRAAEIAKVKQWVDNSEILGAPVIRIFAGHQQKDQTAAQAHSLMVSAMEECCDYAGKHGVHLALENHGGPTGSADGILEFVRDVSSPWFGINLDTGNFQSTDPYADMAKLAPYAINAQIKVDVSIGGKRTPADFKRVAKIMRDANYRGYIVLEYEEAGDVRVECPRYLDQLREAFA
ncbi:MAG TPA: sugar phosphate isomerase/epimerase family protein [Pirellulaceae bacterium]|nr:sugar phosphate isomerase/epimerase family protein [Pirellulaceae bacterium]